MRFLTSTLALVATTAFAAPLLEGRQSATTCGSNYYSYSQVRAAVNSGCNYVSQGGTACSGSCKPFHPSLFPFPPLASQMNVDEESCKRRHRMDGSAD